MYARAKTSTHRLKSFERSRAPCCCGSEMTCCYISRLDGVGYASQWHCHSLQGARYQSPRWLVRALNHLQLSCVFQNVTALILIYISMCYYKREIREKRKKKGFSMSVTVVFTLRSSFIGVGTKKQEEYRVWLLFALYNSDPEETFKVLVFSTPARFCVLTKAKMRTHTHTQTRTYTAKHMQTSQRALGWICPHLTELSVNSSVREKNSAHDTSHF